MDFPIYIKVSYDWFIKLINGFEILEIKSDIWGNLRTTRRIQSYNNSRLVTEWLEDLRTDKDIFRIDKEEFITKYFEAVCELNKELLK